MGEITWATSERRQYKEIDLDLLSSSPSIAAPPHAHNAMHLARIRTHMSMPLSLCLQLRRKVNAPANQEKSWSSFSIFIYIIQICMLNSQVNASTGLQFQFKKERQRERREGGEYIATHHHTTNRRTKTKARLQDK